MTMKKSVLSLVMLALAVAATAVAGAEKDPPAWAEAHKQPPMTADEALKRLLPT